MFFHIISLNKYAHQINQNTNSKTQFHKKEYSDNLLRHHPTSFKTRTFLSEYVLVYSFSVYFLLLIFSVIVELIVKFSTIIFFIVENSKNTQLIISQLQCIKVNIE